MHQASRAPHDSLQPAPPRAAVGGVCDSMWEVSLTAFVLTLEGFGLPCFIRSA